MDKIPPDWLYLGVLWTIIAGSAVSLVRWAVRKRQEVQAAKDEGQRQAERAKQEAVATAERARDRERARATYDRIKSRTFQMGDGEWVHPNVAVQIITAAAGTIATEFMRDHPDAVRSAETALVNREELMRWLATGTKGIEEPFTPLVPPNPPETDNDEKADDAPSIEGEEPENPERESGKD